MIPALSEKGKVVKAGLAATHLDLPIDRQRFALALVSIELVFLYSPTVYWLIERWTMSVWQHAHGLFIPPIVVYLAWQKLNELRYLPRQSSTWGFAFLIPALALHVIDSGIHTQILSTQKDRENG